MANADVTEQLKSILTSQYTSEGHFRLVSGNHTNKYVQARIALMKPDVRKLFVEAARPIISALNVNAVAAYTVGGLLLARAIWQQIGGMTFIVGKAVGSKMSWGRKTGNEVSTEVSWTNDKFLDSESRVLLVDDVFTTISQVNFVLSRLEETALINVLGVLVAVSRSTVSQNVSFRGQNVEVYPCVSISLPIYEVSSCPLCQDIVPIRDLSYPEKDFLSVVLSQPLENAPDILAGYAEVYALQQEYDLIKEMDAWKPWLPLALAGLPRARMEEDSRLIKFVAYINSIAKQYGIDSRVLSEIVGQLVSLSSVKVESRPIGCSIIIGPIDEIQDVLESSTKVKLPPEASSKELTPLVPYFDAFLETGHVLLMDRNGFLRDFRRLVSTRNRYVGVELLRYVTSKGTSLAFVLRRGRRTISVYSNNRLEAVGELSQRTGQWEFSRPMERIEEIGKRVLDIDEVLMMVIEAGRELAGRGHGGLFVIGAHKEKFDHKSPSVSMYYQ